MITTKPTKAPISAPLTTGTRRNKTGIASNATSGTQSIQLR